MDKKLILKGLIAGAVLSIAMPASALVLGTNVTISDENYTSQDWHQNQEDGEVEPGMQHGQVWDLEGVFLSDSALTMVGGYDFENGYGGYMPGDVFLATSGTPDYGDIHRGGSNGNLTTSNTYGYDYVLRLDAAQDGGATPTTFSILALTGDVTLETAYYQQNEGSSPWRLAQGGTVVGGGAVTFYDSESTSELSSSATGFAGTSRYAMSFDLQAIYDAIGTDHTFYSHFTMGCGNDNLMGQWTVPEPATFALFGVGIAGLWLSRRRQTASAQTA